MRSQNSYVQKVNFFSSHTLDFGQALDEVSLRGRAHCVDQEENNRDVIAHHSFVDSCLISDIDCQWFCPVFLYGICLSISSDKGIELVVDRELGVGDTS